MPAVKQPRRMPKGGDIRIPKPQGDVPVGGGDAALGADLAAEHVKPGLVTVMGFDKKDVLLRSDQVNCIQLRDGDGAITALICRIRLGLWGFCMPSDPDFKEMLSIYGNDDKPQG